MGVTSFLLLSCVGLAITVEAQNCPRPQAEPNMNLRDGDILLETFTDGIRVSFVCDPGYVSAGGSSSITCTAGSWSPIRLKCEKRNCGSAGEVLNGQIDYKEGTEFGAKIDITCNNGYRLVGNKQLNCGVQGWMGRLPECEALTCDPPPLIENGNFSPVEESYEYGRAIQYSCRSGYTLVGPQSILCSEDGTFQPAPPTCLRVGCSEPVISNSEWIGGSRPPYGFKATVTYRCLTGYTMTGSGTLSCSQDSQWTPGLPTCIRVATTTTTTTTTTKGTTAATTKGTTAKSSTEMTTTTKPPSAKTPKSNIDPTSTPGSSGISTGQGIGIGFGVVILLVSVCCGCYYGLIKKGSRRDHDKVTTTETVPL